MLAYVDGSLVADTEARISVFDRGLLLGDAVFDTLRTYGGRLRGLSAHTNRLRSGLRYVEMDPAIADTMEEAMIAVNDANKAEIELMGDVFIVAVVTRGRLDVAGGWGFGGDPTTIVYVKKLDLAAAGMLYDRGVDLKVSLMTRHFSGNIDARAKTVDRLGLVRSELKESRFLHDSPEFGRRVWHVVFNDDGSISEAQGANLAILDGDTLVRPPRHTALHGTSLETLCRLADAQGFRLAERPIYLYDILNARATFITASSFSMLPVAAIDGVPVQRDDEAFRRLVDAWIDEVDFDFVEQAQAAAAAVSG